MIYRILANICRNMEKLADICLKVLIYLSYICV
jgi:hypothetical protein